MNREYETDQDYMDSIAADLEEERDPALLSLEAPEETLEQFEARLPALRAKWDKEDGV